MKEEEILMPKITVLQPTVTNEDNTGPRGIPLMKGRRVLYENGGIIVRDFEGYYLTMEEIMKLCRDFMADCHDGFVSNDSAWLESKLKNLDR